MESGSSSIINLHRTRQGTAPQHILSTQKMLVFIVMASVRQEIKCHLVQSSHVRGKETDLIKVTLLVSS